MAAQSISIAQGAAGMKMSDFTVGTLAPNAGDVEVRYNTTDTNSKNILRHDVIVLLYTIIRQLENGGPAADNLLLLNGTTPPRPIV